MTNHTAFEPTAPSAPPSTPPTSQQENSPARRLERDPNGSIAGVASGLAHYVGVDVTIVRLLFVVLTLTAGFGPIFYLLAWLIVPEAKAPLAAPATEPFTTTDPVVTF